MDRKRGGDEGPDEPGTFDFLGFTILWGKSRGTGRWVVKMQTASDRFRRTLKRIVQWCKTNRHASLLEQQRALNRKLRGHYSYFGRWGNRGRCWKLLDRVREQWRKWLRRRSQLGLSWDAMERVLERYPLLTPTCTSHA
jgi:hypothetical protein